MADVGTTKDRIARPAVDADRMSRPAGRVYEEAVRSIMGHVRLAWRE